MPQRKPYPFRLHQIVEYIDDPERVAQVTRLRWNAHQRHCIMDVRDSLGESYNSLASLWREPTRPPTPMQILICHGGKGMVL